MTYDPERDPGEVDRLSYNPMHDYRRVDVDAWAEQWFSGFASLEPGSEDYLRFEQTMHNQLYLHPDEREADAQDLEFGLSVLRSVGAQNPHEATSDSMAERQQYEYWEQMAPILKLIARQVVRVTLEDADSYAAFRVEKERSGTDHLTRVFNRRGMFRRLREQYGITDAPKRRDKQGASLPAIKLTHLYADANRFKWLNDTLGHQVGDAAIIETAWRAKDFLRRAEAPIIYREGGDEFGAILGGLGDYEIEQLTKRVMERQLDRVINPRYKFKESMAAVQEAVLAVRAAGGRVRAEARQRGPVLDEATSTKRPYHTLYINGEPITELRNIIVLSVGVASAYVSTYGGVEQLRRKAEAEMERIKPILQAVMDEEIMVLPEAV